MSSKPPKHIKTADGALLLRAEGRPLHYQGGIYYTYLNASDPEDERIWEYDPETKRLLLTKTSA